MRALVAVVLVGCGAPPGPAVPVLPVLNVESSPARRLPVITEPTCPRGHSCEVVQVVDLHSDADTADKGFDKLREVAVEQHGDAVIGAEFEHGEHGEPSHLSGVVVRYGRYSERRHVELGVIDVASDPLDPKKGLDELNARADMMGGDRVIDITFEHGEAGAQGHLRGKVIRFVQ